MDQRQDREQRTRLEEEVDTLNKLLRENFDNDKEVARRVDILQRELRVNGINDYKLAKEVEEIQNTLELRRPKTKIDRTTDVRQESSSGNFNSTQKKFKLFFAFLILLLLTRKVNIEYSFSEYALILTA